MNKYLADWRKWLAAAVTAVIAAGVTITIATDDPDHPGAPPRRTIEIHVGGKTVPVKVDTDNQIQPAQVAATKHDAATEATNAPDVHEDMRDETPPGITQAEVNAGREQTEAIADKVLAAPHAPAGAQAYSCPDALVRNRSSLNGPRVGTALHFTVSQPGSGPAIRGLFNTPSFGASSNKLMELNGTCWTLVPNTEKAWAQGAANSAYFSIEIVTNDLTRAQWLAAPIIKNGILAALVRDLNRSVGAPLKHVDPVGCAWTPGIVDHDDLECGNTHWDVGPAFPWDVFIKQVRAGVAPHVTSSDRADCRNVHAYRLRRRADKPKTKAGATAFDRRRARVRVHGVRCVDGKARVR